ncbi:MO25 protein [Encephalitozoon hellem]|uniref:MO25 protein n=1 Tax=Encephalitozoon hellem TaxID=27973 RepID=A0A9Q9CBH6_ENCHE|nr:MO25 protein [Encephalitozoon hellem]
MTSLIGPINSLFGMEEIERDREIVRRMKKFDKESMEAACKESLKNKRISYVPNLVAMGISEPMRRNTRPGVLSLKIRGMSTRNILFAVSESFRNINKKIVRKLERIKEELSRRNDLFECIVDHIESMDVIEDELFSWYPGLKTSDILSFFLDLMPDLLEKYKRYFVKSLVLQQPPKRKILKALRDRLHKNLQCFDIIERDLELFEELSKSISLEGRIITSSYWCEDEDRCEDALRLFPQLKDRICLSPDVCIELFHPLSHAEIQINGRDLVVSFVQLNDLLTRNARSLDFWMKEGIVDGNWEYL